jgi:hypothetical protein
MLSKDYDHKRSVEENTAGRESQGAWHQDELISGKPPVVKQMRLTDKSVDLRKGY